MPDPVECSKRQLAESISELMLPTIFSQIGLWFGKPAIRKKQWPKRPNRGMRKYLQNWFNAAWCWGIQSVIVFMSHKSFQYGSSSNFTSHKRNKISLFFALPTDIYTQGCCLFTLKRIYGLCYISSCCELCIWKENISWGTMNTATLAN